MCCFIKENTSGNSKGSKLLRKRGLRHLLAAVGTCAGLLCGSWCRLQQTGLEPRPRLHGPPKLPVPALPSRSISLPGMGPPPTLKASWMNVQTQPLKHFPKHPFPAHSLGSAGRRTPQAVPVARMLHTHPSQPYQFERSPIPAALSGL